jgi:hypothetical protein
MSLEKHMDTQQIELKLKHKIREYSLFDIEEITGISRQDLIKFVFDEIDWPEEKILDCAKMLNII